MLHDLNTRRSRGFLAYEKCTVREFRAFRTQLGIRTKPYDRTKAALVHSLEVADDSQAFGRFMELPEELRAIIYSNHFNSMVRRPMNLRNSLPPPITGVSEALREETLPLWFTTYELPIFDPPSHFPDRPGLQEAEFNERFVRNGPAKYLNMIRYIVVTIVSKTVEIHIDLGTQRAPSSIQIRCLHGWEEVLGPLDDEDICHEVLGKMKEVVEKVSERKRGKVELRRGDVEDFEALAVEWCEHG